jgi:formylglycine-generating enzyme required for sulfatase activity
MRTRSLLYASLLFLLGLPSQANNLSVSNIAIVGTDKVRFDISWDNGWFIPGFNWDAVWIFVKAQDCAGTTTWDHVDLSTNATQHTATGGTGLIVEASSDGKGVFIRRNSLGGLTQSATVTLQFAANMPAAASTNFRVFGTEMVWVPQGNFSVGDGTTNSATQSTAAFGTWSASTPWPIASEGQINGDALRNGAESNTWHNTVPTTFPKGWAGFYCMKYEISQQQYVAFLNALTATQQFWRTANPPTSPAGTLAMTSAANQNRNAIVVATPAAAGAPAVYATDLNGDGTYGDGDDIACNYLSWTDLLSYLDWSGLRPMTELEFEKAARGSTLPVLTEYAWGSTNILQAVSSALNNAGMPSEASTASGNGLCAHNGGSSTTLGPLRTGFAATANPLRERAGASFWGVMDLSGNVWEQTISVGYYNGSARLPATFIFTGANGDGRLTMFTGEFDVTTWPTAAGVGTTSAGTTIVRGGNWESSAQRAQISDRAFFSSVAENLTRVRRTGGRGVRRP